MIALYSFLLICSLCASFIEAGKENVMKAIGWAFFAGTQSVALFFVLYNYFY